MKNYKIGLLNQAPKAFQFLHLETGMDFTKPYEYAESEGKFTLKSLAKLMSLEDNPYNYAIALFIKNDRFPSYDANYVSVIGFDSIEVQFKSSGYDFRVDSFWGKKPFEEMRKAYTGTYYIVAQRKEYLLQTRKKTLDLSERFLLDSSHQLYRTSDGKGKTWISSVYLKPTTANGKSFEYKTPRLQYATLSNDIEDVIDKSGYLLTSRRSDLAWRVKQLKANKASTEVNSIDYSVQTASYESQIAKLKTALTEYFKVATTSSKISKIRTMLFDFERLVSCYEWHLQKIEKQNYSSTGEVKQTFERMDSKIAEIEKQLAE